MTDIESIEKLVESFGYMSVSQLLEDGSEAHQQLVYEMVEEAPGVSLWVTEKLRNEGCALPAACHAAGTFFDLAPEVVEDILRDDLRISCTERAALFPNRPILLTQKDFAELDRTALAEVSLTSIRYARWQASEDRFFFFWKVKAGHDFYRKLIVYYGCQTTLGEIEDIYFESCKARLKRNSEERPKKRRSFRRDGKTSKVR